MLNEEMFLLYIKNSTTHKIFLTVVHIVIHNGSNNGDIHRNLKCCIKSFKTSLKSVKIKINIFHTLKKRNLKTERKTNSNKQFYFTENIYYLQ